MPIFAVANRDTEEAFLILKATTAYPGFYCYYEEGAKGLSNPSPGCLQQVRQNASRPSEKVAANCLNLTVTIPAHNGMYKFWELDEFGNMTWLPFGSQPSYYDGKPMRMAGGTDSIVTTAFATLCPAKFKRFGGKSGN